MRIKQSKARTLIVKMTVVLVLSIQLAIGVANVSKTSRVSAEKNFDEAMKLRDEGKLEQSIKAFQGILSNNPTLQRARLELAVAYFFAVKYSKALKHAQTVLDDPKTPLNVRKTIREFIEKIRAKRPRHKYEPFLSLGFISDSNVTAGPDQSILSGFPSNGVQQKQSDYASLIQFGVTHRFSSDVELNFGKKSATLLWLSKASYYRTDYWDVSTSDLSVFSLGSGPALVSEDNWRAGVNFKYDNINLGSSKYAEFLAINPSLTIISKDGRHEVTLDVFMQSRDYKRSVDLGRDSDYVAYGLSYGRVLRNDKLSYQVGFRLFDEKANLAYNSNDGVEFFVGLSWRFSKINKSYFRVSDKSVTYGGVEPGLSVIRDEKIARYILGFEHRFQKSWLKGWTAVGHISFSRSQSNEAIFEYDRTQIGVTFRRYFD